MAQAGEVTAAAEVARAEAEVVREWAVGATGQQAEMRAQEVAVRA